MLKNTQKLIKGLNQAEELAKYLVDIYKQDQLQLNKYSNIFEAIDAIGNIDDLKLYCLEQSDKIQLSKSLAKIVIQLVPVVIILIQNIEKSQNSDTFFQLKIQELQESSIFLMRQCQELKIQFFNSLSRLQSEIRVLKHQKNDIINYIQKIHDDYMAFINRLIKRHATTIQQKYKNEQVDSQSSFNMETQYEQFSSISDCEDYDETFYQFLTQEEEKVKEQDFQKSKILFQRDLESQNKGQDKISTLQSIDSSYFSVRSKFSNKKIPPRDLSHQVIKQKPKIFVLFKNKQKRNIQELQHLRNMKESFQNFPSIIILALKIHKYLHANVVQRRLKRICKINI